MNAPRTYIMAHNHTSHRHLSIPSHFVLADTCERFDFARKVTFRLFVVFSLQTYRLPF